MKKSYKILILKNTLAIAIPAIAVFVVLIGLLVKFPIFDHINDVKLNKEDIIGVTLEEKLEDLYKENKTNVHIELTDLYYTGFDYKVDGKQKGAYYYCMDEGKLNMFLIDTKKPKDYIESITIKGKIIKDSVTSAHILSALVQSNGIDSKLLDGYVSEYVVSELDYPKAYIVLVYLFYATPIMISVLILIYTGIVWLRPDKHSQSRQLSNYGEINEVIDDIDEQLSGDDVFRRKNIYITPDYMLVNYLTKTDVIRLDVIKYLSKNDVTKRNFFGKKIKVFRLTISNPDKIFYEVDFGNEELCDDVMTYIDSVNG